VIGGVLFLVIVLGAIARRPLPLHATTAEPAGH
jgi:hypothetical protein